MIWALHGAVGQAADWNDFVERMLEAGHRSEERRVGKECER